MRVISCTKPLKIYCLLAALVFTACTKKSTEETDNIYQFKAYISQHTSGLVSIADPIRIELASVSEVLDLAQELPQDYLKITPKTKGKLLIENGQQLIFIPEEPLVPDTEYSVSITLDKFYEDLPRAFQTYTFSFKTLKPQFKINIEELQSYDNTTQYLSGYIEFNDMVLTTTFPELLAVKQLNKPLKIMFQTENEYQKTARFIIDSIQRFDEDTHLSIVWEGAPISSTTSGNYNYAIPGKNNFKVLTTKTFVEPTRYLKINFSDPLKPNQNFDGLVALQNTTSLSYEVDGNVLLVYPSSPITGSVLLEVFDGITNSQGYKLKNTFSEQISFEQIKPALRPISKGVILPNSNGTPFYFEAVNLNAVELRVIKIFQDNVLQHLQAKNLKDDNDYQINQVGRRILKKTIPLADKAISNDGQWKAYGLDLSEYFRADSGALYRIELSFNKEQVDYKCNDQSNTDESTSEDYFDDYYDDGINYDAIADDEEAREQQYWDNRIYNWRRYNYNWRQENNPCHEAYYNDRRLLSSTLLGSNLGVIAKKGTNNSYHFATSNLLTAQPEVEVSIKLYDYQQQLIQEISTNEEGLTLYDSDRHISFAVAYKNNNYAYLKLGDGNALS
ncbi:MAG: hypothetical protein RQ756_00580, partial [Flavobacteriaceae bacterium]|nr:hypothetical protein [Flavobacteriaceae bacterium]